MDCVLGHVKLLEITEKTAVCGLTLARTLHAEAKKLSLQGIPVATALTKVRSVLKIFIFEVAAEVHSGNRPAYNS
jgi:hypothetical protein